MARKIQANIDLGPEGLSETWFPVDFMNIEKAESKGGEDMLIATFTVRDGNDQPLTVQKYFTPFHSESPFPRHIWNTFARGMGSVGYAPQGATGDALLEDSAHWLMPDRVGCKQEESVRDELKWVPINFDWGEAAGPAQLYEPAPAHVSQAVEVEEEEEGGPPPGAPPSEDLPF